MQGAGSFFSQQNIVSISESEKESLRTQSHSGDSSQALSATKSTSDIMEVKKRQTSSALREKLSLHLGGFLNYEFLCPYCKEPFKQPSGVKKHIALAHPDVRPFRCPECNAAFATSSNMNQHMQVHKKSETRNKFRCAFCSNSYFYKNSLKKHMTEKHPNQILATENHEDAEKEENKEVIELEPPIKKQPKIAENLQEIQSIQNNDLDHLENQKELDNREIQRDLDHREIQRDLDPIENQLAVGSDPLSLTLLSSLMIDNLTMLNNLLTMQYLRSKGFSDTSRGPKPNNRGEETKPLLTSEVALQSQVIAQQLYMKQRLHLLQPPLDPISTATKLGEKSLNANLRQRLSHCLPQQEETMFSTSPENHY